MHNLVSTPLEGCRYECVHVESSSLCFNYAFSSPLDHCHVSPMCSLPFLSLEYYIDIPIDKAKISDPNVDLGYKDKMFNMFGGNVDNFVSLGT